MRFLLLMIPHRSEHDWTPDPNTVAAMGKYNDSLRKAGALLALDALHPPSQGARIEFAGGKSRVRAGALATEARGVLGAYWLIQVKSQEEAVEWARRCPASDGSVIELRRVLEAADLPPGVRNFAPGA